MIMKRVKIMFLIMKLCNYIHNLLILFLLYYSSTQYPAELIQQSGKRLQKFIPEILTIQIIVKQMKINMFNTWAIPILKTFYNISSGN